MEDKILEFIEENGYDFMDSWQEETTGTVKQLFRKFNEEIIVEYIINKDNL